MNMKTRQPPFPERMRGFTYVEALLAMLIMVVAIGIALSLFLDFGQALNTETGKNSMQQSSRMAIDDLTRISRQIGYGIRRPDVHNVATWQRGLVHGGPYELAFNANIDAGVGTLPKSQTIGFAIGDDYTGEGAGATINGAETYVYTIDANDDGAITAADRNETVSGSFNPAAESPNPFDFSIYRRVYGFNGTDYGGELEPLAGNLFTNATTDSVYPDGSSPAPLFSYTISEDLNQDGTLSSEECVNNVVDNCPPLTTRTPMHYIWGDSDFDNWLSESEKSALRSLEVGSPAWSHNPIASGGSFKSTTLATAVTGSGSEYELGVADGTQLGRGFQIRVGTGSGAENVTVDTVDTATTPDTVTLTSPLTGAHAVGAAVTVLPATILNAVRSVELNYGAISEQRDVVDGTMLAGRAGGKGSNGLDYRITPLRRTIRILNATTGAAPGLNDSESICPLKIVNACSGAATDSSVRYVGATSQPGPTFLVTDALDNPMENATVDFTQSGTTVGLLTATSATSNVSGMASAGYTLTGTLGTDTITASVTCTDTDGTAHTSTATNDITAYSLTTTIATDCMSTLSTRTTDGELPFTIEVVSGSGPVVGEKVWLGLELDPSYLEYPPDYSAVIGELTVGGVTAGTTGSTGALAPTEYETDSTGKVAGSFGLTSETTGEGARLELAVQIPQAACSGSAATFSRKVDYFKLELEPIEPASACSEYAPCIISAGDDVPIVGASLSIGGNPIANAPLDFSLSDTLAGGAPIVIPPGVSVPQSMLIPPSGIETDSSGLGTAMVSNNGSPVITPTSSLETVVDVTSPGPAGMCSAGDIVSSTDEVWLDFHTPMTVCDTNSQQAYVVKKANDKLCLHVLNANDANPGCPQTIKGFQIKTYLADGTVDPNASGVIKEVKGGAVSATASCSNSDAVQIFKDTCKSPKAKLANGEDWMFTDFSDCSLPKKQTKSGEFFTLHEIRFNADFLSGKDFDFTVYYECTDACQGIGTTSKTFNLKLP